MEMVEFYFQMMLQKKILGLSNPNELLSHSWGAFIDKGYFDHLRQIEQELKNNPQLTYNHNLRANRLDGTKLDLEVTSSNIEYNGKPARQLIFRDITDRKRQEDLIKEYAYKDILTGLLNRRAFMDELNKLVNDSLNHDRDFALMFMDLDGFKKVNDSFGHDGVGM